MTSVMGRSRVRNQPPMLTSEQVLALAPDPASAKSGQGLATKRKWLTIARQMVEAADWLSGDHRPEGVYVAAGPDIAAGDGAEISLADFAG